MATPSVLTFDTEGGAVDFEVWVDNLQLFLQCDRGRRPLSLRPHLWCLPFPPATADSTRGDAAPARARGARALEGLAGAVEVVVGAVEGVGVVVGVVAGVARRRQQWRRGGGGGGGGSGGAEVAEEAELEEAAEAAAAAVVERVATLRRGVGQVGGPRQQQQKWCDPVPSAAS
ncbi:unnamed protein product [Closterium sp. NIES-64]|nr:unnamed protein product [Closterium sp. NIES-64]